MTGRGVRPLFGPAVMDLFREPDGRGRSFVRRAMRDQTRMIRQAADLGATAFGLMAWEPNDGAWPFEGGDLARPSREYRRFFVRAIRAIEAAGMVPVVSGLLGPAIRRYSTEWPKGMTASGVDLTETDVKTIGSPHSRATEPYLDFWRAIQRWAPDALFVDGVEPFFGPWQSAPPLNPFQLAVREASIGRLHHYIELTGYGEGMPGDGRIKVHVNPGEPDVSGFGGGILETDGWGLGAGYMWTLEDGSKRPFAGLPAIDGARVREVRPRDRDELAAELVAEQMVDYYRDAARMGRSTFLVLHTANWSTATHAEALAGGGSWPTVDGIRVRPWTETFRALRRAAPPVPTIDEIGPAGIERHHGGGDDVLEWPITSNVAEASIRRTSSGAFAIRFRHSMGGRWPEVAGVEANIWLVFKVGGKWQAATFEWLRRGQANKTLADFPAHLNIFDDHDRTITFEPARGDRVGLFVSGLARLSERTVRERSSIAAVTVE